MNPRWPNFLVIGAGKCGTTSLYHYLKQHPEVFLPAAKETNFFALVGHRPRRTEDDPERRFYWPEAVTDERQYTALFTGAKPRQKTGEVSPMYLYAPQAPARIQRALPGAKLIVILRDPAERLWSRYLHLVRDRRAPEGGFEEALNRDSIWWRRDDLVNEGRYHTHLQRYYEHFPHEQILVLLHRELVADPKALMAKVFAHIGVAPTFNVDVGARHNASGTIAKPWLHALIGGGGWLPTGLHNLSPVLWQHAREQPLIQQWVNNARRAALHRPCIPSAVRTKLITEVYGPEIASLESLLKRDLSPWLKAA